MKISFVDVRPTIVVSILLPTLWKISKLSLTPLLPRVSFPVTSKCTDGSDDSIDVFNSIERPPVRVRVRYCETSST
jgi:hypothetical protein